MPFVNEAGAAKRSIAIGRSLDVIPLVDFLVCSEFKATLACHLVQNPVAFVNVPVYLVPYFSFPVSCIIFKASDIDVSRVVHVFSRAFHLASIPLALVHVSVTKYLLPKSMFDSLLHRPLKDVAIVVVEDYFVFLSAGISAK
jgi:hypothetical protein